MNGKKVVDTARYMTEFSKSQLTHANALKAAEIQHKEANAALDDEIELDVVGVKISQLEEANEKEALTSSLISRIYPFVIEE